ncbi:molting protein mlt-4 [Anaeramoeba flamelloides]|uniref:Molting protein mlt-4 n=1 Tax=Anaeramoeba flamelloides TaxID=1746091 RepID=A0ABQ8XZM9_9EUKA|nr:molting protein mlt-4 [Anaeramoeba flamelloides]
METGAVLSVKWTKLHFFSRDGNLEELKKVMNEISNIDEMKSDNWTALHLATLNDHCECVSYLLSKGADPLLKTNKKKTALEIAILQNNKCIYEILYNMCKEEPLIKIRDSLYNEENIKDIPEHLSEDFCGLTFLHLSIIFGNEYLFAKYSNKGKNVLDFYQNSALHYCSIFGRLKFLKSLIQMGAKINQVNTHKSTPLLLASKHCQAGIVQELLLNGAKLRANNHGTNPIHFACYKGSVEVLSELFASKDGKLIINSTRNDGSTPVHLAILGESAPCLELLYLALANFAIPNSLGEYPIYIAVKIRNLEIIKFLLQVKNRVKHYNTNQTTALHLCACRNDIEIIKLLLESKIFPINCKDHLGNTPLHIAAENNHFEVIKILLKYNSKLDIKNNIGLMPKEIVKESKCLNLLKWIGKDISKLQPSKIEKIELAQSFMNELKLFWLPPNSFDKILHYNVTISGNKFNKLITTNETTILIDSLKKSQTYKIKVCATNFFGKGPYSKQFSFKTSSKNISKNI